MEQDKKLDDSLGKRNELPSGWWQNATASLVLMEQLENHLLPLLIVGSVNGKPQHNLCSGMLVNHGELYFWLTAGHVIDFIKDILSSPHFKLSKIAWLDGYKTPMAESVNLHRKNIPMKSWVKEGIDVGVALPSYLDVGNLLVNKKFKTIDSKIWENLDLANPEGYYAIGYPHVWSNIKETPAANNKTLKSLDANPACLPLEMIDPPLEFANDPVWSNPEAFYGKILSYADYPEFDLDDPKGMSGGPIISVERDPDGRIRYRLVGIIQSFAPGQAMFRAEPILKVAEVIDGWLEEMLKKEKK